MKMDKECEMLPFEEALNRTGYGLYNHQQTVFTSLVVIAFACVAYGSTVLVPASACELGTNSTQQGALVAVPLIGSILGALIWGFLGDTRGRWRMLLTSLALAAFFNAIASLSVNWIMLMIFQFFATVMAAGQYTLSIALLSECLPLARRNVVLLLVSSISFLSQGILSVLAIPVIPLTFSFHLPSLGIYWNSWRSLMLVYCIPNILCCIWLVFMHESPKFLLAKGKDDEALEVLRKIHNANHRKEEEYDVMGLISETTSSGKPPASESIMPLFRAPLLKFTICMATLNIFKQVGAFSLWLPTIANQYVIILETGEGMDLPLCRIIDMAVNNPPEDTSLDTCAINVSALLIVFIVSAMQSFANLLCALVVNKVGRRNLTIILTSSMGICGIIVNLVPNAIGSAVFFAIFLLGLIVLGLYTAMVVALFPTNVRAMAISIMVSSGRLSSFASIQILNYLLQYNCEVGFYVFASIFTSSALVASFLPDDRKLKEEPKEDPKEEKTIL